MKKIGLQTWLIFIFMLAALAGCGKSAADRWQEQYDLGAQYLLEENYEQAIVAFAAAIEIEPKEIQAYTGLVQGYQQTGDLASADSAVQSGLSVLSEGSGLSVDAQTAFLLAARDLYTATGDSEKLTQILELLLELDPDNAEYQSFLERERAVQEFLAAHEDLLQRLAQLCESGDDEDVWEVMRSEEYAAMISDAPAYPGNNNIPYPSGTGTALAIVENTYDSIADGLLYYGEMENGVRSGEGVQYGTYDTSDGGYSYHKYTGGWENDLVNGQGTYRIVSYSGDGQVAWIQERSGECAAGIENGARTLSYQWSDGTTDTFHYTVENGEAVVIAVSDFGENIAAYAEANPNTWLYFEGEVKLFENYGAMHSDFSGD